MTNTLDTELRFYEDVYQRELDVWVDALVQDARYGSCLTFSATLCHPHGGGQKGDRATLLLPPEAAQALERPAGLSLVDTRKAEGRILHVLGDAPATEALEATLLGTRPFTLRLDWAFRGRQMRLHSAAHLLHLFVEQVLGRTLDYPETSDLQPDFGLNRYERPELLTQAQLDEVLARLNAFTAAGHPIATRADPVRAGFRTWHCEDWTIPCGGTHPADTREIGPVQADLSLKRGRTSLVFRVGDA